MWPDNDNMPPRDYFMPKLSPWRWVWLALAFSVPIMFLAALVKTLISYLGMSLVPKSGTWGR